MLPQTKLKPRAYQEIQRAVRLTIEQEKLRPGDPLPSERELARAHKVSLMTARSALAGLEREGLVERRRGVGTFVAVPKINYNKLLSTTELLSGRGLTARSRTIEARIVQDQPEIAARLGVPMDHPLVKLTRLRQVEEQPLALETSYLSADRFGSILQGQLQGGSLFTTLEEKYNTKISHADEEVDATVADKPSAELLRITVHTPVLRIRQLIYSPSGEPILYTLGLYRSDRHKLLIRRYRK